VCEDTLEMLPSGAQTRVTRRVLHARVLYVKRADRKWLATVVRCNMRLFFLIDSVVAVSWYLFWSFLPALLTSEVFQPNIVEEIKTHILCSVTFSQKSCLLWDNVEIYCRAGQTKDDNMTHAHCMLGNKGYKHTLEYVILLDFPLTQCLRESASVAVVTIYTTGFNILSTQCIYEYCMDFTRTGGYFPI